MTKEEPKTVNKNIVQDIKIIRYSTHYS